MAPDAPPDPIRVALAFAATCDRLGIAYLAVGSLASSIHGEPRSTDDVDFVADLRPGHVTPLVAALTPAYYVDVALAAAVAHAGSFNVIHLDTAVKVDVFVAGTDAFQTERLARRQRVRVWDDPPGELWVDTAEHTVLRKLEWYRRGGEVSDRQWRDVLGVLRAQRGRVDRTRLDAWAQRLGVSDLLERAVHEAWG
jgi:hypothetical protein